MKKTELNMTSEKRPSILDAIITVDTIEVKETRWIIQHAIPRGGLTVVAGREECGKSTLLSQICVAVASGTISPLDSPISFQGREKMKALYIDAEESTNVIGQRFRALGANNNVAVLDKKNPLVSELTTTSAMMRELVEGHRPDLLVLSPISSFLPAKCKATCKKDVVQALRPLMDLADDCDCAIVILQHTNKQESTDYRKCLADSSYFSEAPRSVILMGKTQHQGEVFASVEKGSLTSVYDPFETRLLQFRRDRQELEFVGTTTKKWRDFVIEAQGRDIADTAKVAARIERKSKMTETKEAIIKVLTQNGTMTKEDLISASLEAGASTGMWERAKKALIEENVIEAFTVHHGQSKTTTYNIAEEFDGGVHCFDDLAGGGAA